MKSQQIMNLWDFFFSGDMIMLKLNASYSKKVPAEGEYSSQSYHAIGKTVSPFSCRKGACRGSCSLGRLVVRQLSCSPPCCPVFATFPTPFLQIVYDRSA